MAAPRKRAEDLITGNISIRFTQAQHKALKEISDAQRNSMAAVARTFISWGIKEWEKIGNDGQIGNFQNKADHLFSVEEKSH